MKAMLFCALAGIAFTVNAQEPQAVSRSQAEAVREFPALAQPGSEFNKRFVERVHSLQTSGDSLLLRDDWPEVLAKQIGIEVGIAPLASVTARPAPTLEETLQAVKVRMAALRQAENEKAYQETVRRENESADEARLEKALESITYGVRAETTFLRNNQIEGEVTPGDPDYETENVALNSVQHRVYNFVNVVFRPDVNGPERLGANLGALGEEEVENLGAGPEERILEIKTEGAKFWAIIDDVDTTGLLSDQYIYLEVYDLGETVEKDERRYKKLTASKQKAIEFLKANEATRSK